MYRGTKLETILQWERDKKMNEQIQTTTASIAELNDRFRTGKDCSQGRWTLTRAVQALSLKDQKKLIKTITTFDQFNEENDVCGKHDFGSVELNNEIYFWKISYLDNKYQNNSEDPNNPGITRRVLTIMHALEH